jgi:ubiquinone/menaquinone biosynthesis C-methylase UbiE
LPNNPAPTGWDPSFDDRPTSDDPRIRFSHLFSRKYLNKKNVTLEIGCGTGSYTQIVDRKGWLGLDLDINAVKISKRYCKCTEFVVASALNLPFRDQIFGLICMWEVFEEIPKGTEKRVMAEVHRTSKSNSTFLLSVSNDHIVSKILDPAFIFKGSRHYHIKRLMNLISESGFSVTEHTIRGSLDTIIANFLFFFCKHVLKRREASIKTFFNKKSNEEFISEGDGIVYIFIAATKTLLI